MEEWKQVADGFRDRRNFPRCLGTLGGKHISFGVPPRSGSTINNPTSVIVMAHDSSHKFPYVNLESSEMISDDRIFGGSSVDALESRIPNIPSACTTSWFCIVADEGFPLKECILKPYPNCILPEEQHTFRPLHGQRMVDHASTVFANHFRVVMTTISFQDFAKVENIPSFQKNSLQQTADEMAHGTTQRDVVPILCIW